MDITTVFGTVIGGSNPSGCTIQKAPHMCGAFCIVHPEGFEPPITVPKTVVISISPWVHKTIIYYT